MLILIKVWCICHFGYFVLFVPLNITGTATSEPCSYTKSNFNGASLPDDSSISMSIMESPIRRSSINVTTSDSPFQNGSRQDKTCEESLETWSNDLYNYASQKLTSTMNKETVDSLRMAFEPRMCSSRLIISSIQESKVQQTSGIAANSDSGLTCLKEHKDDGSGFGLFKGLPDSCNSSNVIIDDFRKECTDACERLPPALPFGQQQKAVPMDANSDSGFNTGSSASSFEPTEMEVVEGR